MELRITDSVKNLNFDKKLINEKKAKEIIKQLITNRNRVIVSAGEAHSKNTHSVVLLINAILKNINKTINIRSFSARNTSFLEKQTFEESVKDIELKIKNGKIKSIISLGVDLTRFISVSDSILKKLILYI